MSKQYRINEFAQRIGRATSTIRRWEREGKLTAKRRPSGQRYFDESDVRAMLGGAPDKRLTVVCCRVSVLAPDDAQAFPSRRLALRQPVHRQVGQARNPRGRWSLGRYDQDRQAIR